MQVIIKKELFQWEKNRYIFIDLEHGDPPITCVRFYNKKSSTAINILYEDGKAKIPDSLLTEPYPIIALICTLKNGEEQVIKRKELKVIRATKPNDYIGEDTEGGEVTGANGATFVPEVSVDGVLSWTNDKGLPNPEPVDLVGKTIEALPKWEGNYTITPKASNKEVLQTKGSVMIDDLTIQQIPYFDTSNEYGTTIYIASEV